MASEQLSPERREAYWNKTRTLMWTIMAIWLVASLIIPAFADSLNNIVILGFPLGFYMAAQGSLVVFVILCFWNASAQNRIDEEYGVAED